MTNTNNKQIYKISAAGLFAIFAMMVIPGSVLEAESTATGLSVYGMIDLVQKDASGNVVQTQTIHNAITDEGEAFLIDQVFETSDAAADNRIGAICIHSATYADAAAHEAVTATSAGTNALTTEAHCLVDTDVDDTTVTSGGVVGPLIFTGGTNLGATETINSIVICSSNGGTTPYDNCDDGVPAVAFAVRNVNAVTLALADTVEVTYTFDVVSDNEPTT